MAIGVSHCSGLGGSGLDGQELAVHHHDEVLGFELGAQRARETRRRRSSIVLEPQRPQERVQGTSEDILAADRYGGGVGVVGGPDDGVEAVESRL